MAKFLVSVGDSDKYALDFNGDKKQFENSEVLANLKDKVADYLKKEFPTGGFDAVVPFNIMEDDGAKDYMPLNEKTLPQLLSSAATQVDVLRRTNLQNLNAPFDKE